MEELLQSVQTLEESLQDLPSLEDHIAEVERLTEQMERELEEYLMSPRPSFCIILHHCIREVSQ